MKKIIIEKEEGIAEVVDKVLEETDEEITLVVPKGSVLGKSVRNFHLLRREADGAGKTVVIESVDDTILAFAKESDLEGSHPLWRGVRGSGGVSDIIPAERDASPDEEEKPAPKKRGKKAAGVKLTIRTEEEGEEEEEAEADAMPIVRKLEEEYEETEEKENQFLGVGRFFKKSPMWRGGEGADGEDADAGDSGRNGRRKALWIGAGIIALLVAGFCLVTWSFGHIAITVEFKKTPWSYDGTFMADKSVSAMNAAQNTIPAQIFTSDKNATQLFPASGKANVSIKAQGTLTVWNAYSSAAQQLVATTRFVTPDGKIFRLAGAITVPGAKVTNGQIVPSSIDAAVVADQAGPDYNVGPVDKLTIPGFQGSPKYTAFYGQLKSGAAGGFVGNRAVPTAADITAAKAKISDALKANLASAITTSYPNNFKILDGATSVQVTKLTVSTTTDASGNFSVFGEATLQAIGFDENAFRNFLLELAQKQEPSSTFSALTLDYSGVQPDFGKGRVTFALAAQGSLEPAFSGDDFKTAILGKSINDARTAIAGLPELASGRISAWPMWLWNVPSDPGKVEVSSN